MNDLYDELLELIVKNLSLISLISLSSVNKKSCNMINSDFNENVYNIAIKNDVHNKGLEYLNKTNFYTEYNKNLFYLNHNEAIIFYKELNCKPSAPGTILITVSSNGIYRVYEFCRKVNDNECTPDYYNYDDFGSQVLKVKMLFNKIKDINITIALSSKNRDEHYKFWGRNMICQDYLNYDDIMKEIWGNIKKL